MRDSKKSSNLFPDTFAALKPRMSVNPMLFPSFWGGKIGGWFSGGLWNNSRTRTLKRVDHWRGNGKRFPSIRSGLGSLKKSFPYRNTFRWLVLWHLFSLPIFGDALNWIWMWGIGFLLWLPKIIYWLWLYASWSVRHAIFLMNQGG